MRTREELSHLLEEGNYRRISRGAGLTPQYISRVLRGKRGCSFRSAMSIADAAGVTVDELRAFIATRTKTRKRKAA